MITSSANPHGQYTRPSPTSASSAPPSAAAPPLSLARQSSATRAGNTSVLMSVQPPPSALSRQKTEDSVQLQAMLTKYTKQTQKLDRLTITHNKLKKQHKQHETVLIRERAQYENELIELREQLKTEKLLRRNTEQQLTSYKEHGDGNRNNAGSSSSSSSSSSSFNATSATSATSVWAMVREIK